MFLTFRNQVEQLLADALQSCQYPNDDLALVVKPGYADLTSLVAFKLAPVLKLKPDEIARNVAKYVRPDKIVARTEAAGAYINFFTSDEYLRRTLKAILEADHQYGHIGANGVVILEHTSANPNGPLHIGHVRNSVIGDALRRCLQQAGYHVETQYYVNDMGRQIALVVWGIMNFALTEGKKSDHATADIYVQANADVELHPAKLAEVRQLMQRFETGDQDVEWLFKDAVEFCLRGINETLKNLRVTHDRFVWESEFLDDIDGIISELQSYGVTERDGSTHVDLSSFGISKDLVIRRSDGTSVYATRDIAYHVWKAGRCNRMIDVLGADHKLTALQVGKVLELLNVNAPEVVFFEFVSLPEGSMSTRRGHFVSADDVLEKVTEKAYEEVDKRRPSLSEDEKRGIARAVGIGATRYDMLRVSADKPMIFDWNEALDFERQGAPFLQYAHARATSILAKTTFDLNYDPNLLRNEHEIKLIKECARFPAVIKDVATNLSVGELAAYARELAEAFNQFYRFVPVLSAEPPVSHARLVLVTCARIVLRNVLNCLGIEPVNSM
ncbi:MAG TPA: arginine--tRNA ligase [Candidatus Bathyarchaeia archaeon]|nr:arginine--tRNA ligase [Candidatus Bathyarchaeia archaeon]